MLGDLGKDLANLDAGGIGRDRLKGRVALDVPGVDLTGSAFKPQQNDGLGFAGLGSGGRKSLSAAEPQIITQSDAQKSQGANAKEITSRAASAFTGLTFGFFLDRRRLL